MPRDRASTLDGPVRTGIDRRDLVLVGGLVVMAAACYAAFWSGQYFHDGPVFIGMLERHRLAWVHLTYLPVSWLLWRVLGFLQLTEEQVLNMVSVASGSFVVGVVFLSARAIGVQRWPAILASVCTFITPALFFGATIAEIHVYAAAAAGAGLFASVVVRRALLLGPLGMALPALGHMSCALLAPIHFAFMWHRRRWAAPRAAIAALGAGLAGLAIVRGVASFMPQGDTRSLLYLEGLVNLSVQEVARPDLLRHLRIDLLAPWMGLIAAPFLALHVVRPWPFGVIVFLVSATLLWSDFLAQFPVHGQFAIILTPTFGLLMAMFLARIWRRPRLRSLALVCIGVHFVLSGMHTRTLRPSADQSWARRVGAVVVAPARVITTSALRKAEITRGMGLPASSLYLAPSAFHDTGVEGLRSWIESLLSEGTKVYVDTDVFGVSRVFDDLTPFERCLAEFPREELTADVVLLRSP